MRTRLRERWLQHTTRPLCAPLPRGLLNLAIAFCILLTISWTPCNVAPAIAKLLNMPIVGLVPSWHLGSICDRVSVCKATWHLGRGAHSCAMRSFSFSASVAGCSRSRRRCKVSCHAQHRSRCIRCGISSRMRSWPRLPSQVPSRTLLWIQDGLRGRWWCPYGMGGARES